MLGLDEGVLPYDLTARAAEIADLTDQATLDDANVDDALNSAGPGRGGRLLCGCGRLFEAAKGSSLEVPSDYCCASERPSFCFASRSSSAATSPPSTGGTARRSRTLRSFGTCRGYRRRWPHSPSDPADTDAALAALDGVGYTYYGKEFSREVFLLEQERHDPSYERIFWGGMGHLPEPIDVMPAYGSIKAGDTTSAESALTSIADDKLAELEARLSDLCGLLERVTPMVEALH